MAFVSSDTSAGGARGWRASPLVFKPAVVILASVLAAAGIALAGSLSDICVGDENVHHRQATVYALYGERVPYDPQWRCESHVSCALFSTPLWYAGLAVLWKAWGADSQVLAQVYQAGYFLLFVLSVYFAARKIWDESAASWAWLLAATVPLVCVYSLLLLQDIPGIAVSAVGILLLWRKRFFWAGVAFAAAYLLKMNMLSFGPWAVLFAAWWSNGGWRQRVWAATLVAAPFAAAFAYDAAWRMAHYGSLGAWLGVPVGLPGLSGGLAAACIGLYNSRYTMLYYDPVYSPGGLLTNIGIPVLVGIPAALCCAWDKASRWLWLSVGLAAAGYLLVFVAPLGFGWASPRYLLPMLLGLLLLSGRALSRWRFHPWLKGAVVAAVLAQASLACLYVYQQRQIPEGDKAAYAWIRRNTEPDAVILCSEGLVLTRQTGRCGLWNSPIADYVVSEASDAERQDYLRYFHVSYIAIGVRRVYPQVQSEQRPLGWLSDLARAAREVPFRLSVWGSPPSEQDKRPLGGYSADFVRAARQAPYLQKVYESPCFLVFKVNLPGPAPATSPANRLPCGTS